MGETVGRVSGRVVHPSRRVVHPSRGALAGHRGPAQHHRPPARPDERQPARSESRGRASAHRPAKAHPRATGGTMTPPPRRGTRSLRATTGWSPRPGVRFAIARHEGRFGRRLPRSFTGGTVTGLNEPVRTPRHPHERAGCHDPRHGERAVRPVSMASYTRQASTPSIGAASPTRRSRPRLLISDAPVVQTWCTRPDPIADIA